MYACRTLAIENSIRLCLSLKESYFKDLSNVCYRNITARKSDCHKPGPNCARETLRDGRDYSRSGSTPSGGVKHKQAPARIYGTRLQIHLQFTFELFIQIHAALMNTNAS